MLIRPEFDLVIVETARLSEQSILENSSDMLLRNRLGQYATPPMLARELLECARELLTSNIKIRFLEPALGTGALYSALLSVFNERRLQSAQAFEVDLSYAMAASRLWDETSLRLTPSDFTRATPPTKGLNRANLIVANPPYVRHHHLRVQDKARLHNEVQNRLGLNISKLSGLYCYFPLLSDAWLDTGGLAGWLLPSEFMNVNYGEALRVYLSDHVTLLRVHRFDPREAQFADALVTSAVVWYRKTKPSEENTVNFTYGGSLLKPRKSQTVTLEELRNSRKWAGFSNVEPKATIFTSVSMDTSKTTTIRDLFTVSRGLATGANDFFILSADQAHALELPGQFLTPILPSSRHVPNDEILADQSGLPILEPRKYLLNCDLPPERVRDEFPSLWRYLEYGVQMGVNQGYLCQSRTPWYVQEKRPATLFLCTYMGRQRHAAHNPFRFILNHSRATASNSYLLLYPKPRLETALQSSLELARLVWQALGKISIDVLKAEGRVYGGGLHKLEPKELGGMSAVAILKLLEKHAS